MQSLTLLEGEKFHVTIQRLCYQLIENHQNFSNTVIIGLQPRGVYLSQRIAEELNNILDGEKVNSGVLDITFLGMIFVGEKFLFALTVPK